MRSATRFWLSVMVIFFGFGLDSSAQLHIGVRGGINFANFRPANVISFETRVRPNFAVLISKSISPILSIQLEPGFSQLGAKYDISGEAIFEGQNLRTEDVGKISINYIQLPVMLQYKPKFGKFEGIFSLGPEVRYRAGQGKLHYNSKIYYGGVLTKDETGKTNLSPNLRDLDYGLAGGAGLAYPIGNLKIFTEARYHLGLRKVYKEGVDMYNRGPSVHIGVMLPL